MANHLKVGSSNKHIRDRNLNHLSCKIFLIWHKIQCDVVYPARFLNIYYIEANCLKTWLQEARFIPGRIDSLCIFLYIYSPVVNIVRYLIHQGGETLIGAGYIALGIKGYFPKGVGGGVV